MEVIQPCTEQTYLNQIRYQYTYPTLPWQHFKHFDLGPKAGTTRIKNRMISV
jgi:hypothetical protein